MLVASLLLSFGTLAPCGIAKQMLLRRMMEDKDLKGNPFMALGLSAMGNAIDAMSPPKCAYGAVRMALGSGLMDQQESASGSDKEKVSNQGAKEATPLSSEKQAYLEKIDLYDFTAKYQDAVLDGRVPGVNFKIKNKGDRTLSKVEVTVYFKSPDGTVIAEESYYPVLVTEESFSGDNKPLKPNYIWQQERGHFYTAKNVPSEWKEGAASAKITAIEFADDNNGK